MGYYIETNGVKNKTEWIIANAKGIEQNGPMPGNKDMIPVVVVDNGPFEAAGIAFDQDELYAFTRVSDTRPKRFLLVPREEIIRLQPHVEKLLRW